MRRRKRTLLAHPKRRLAATLYGLIGLGTAARAQQVLMPAPSYNTTPPAVEAERENGGGNVGAFQSFVGAAENPGYWLTWGPVVANPHATYSASYSTGINTAPGDANNSIIQTFNPGVTLNLGKHWVLDYEPTFTYYSSSQLKDTVNHSLTLTGGGAWEDWTYGLTQTYNLNGDPNAATGMQTSIQSYDTSVNVAYGFNSQISSQTSLSQAITSADQFNSTTSWTGSEFINYQFFPTLTGGLGGTYTYDAESQGQNMMSEQLTVRLDWRVFQKLSLSVNVGVEDSQFLGGGVPDEISPTFGAIITYAAAPHTTLTLNASRGLTPSILFSQASETTAVSVGLTQRILRHLDFSANATYSQIEYLATTENLTSLALVNNNGTAEIIDQTTPYLIPDRKDNAYSLNTSLNWAIRKHMTFSLTYSYSRDESSAGGLSYATSQEGFSFSYHF